MQPYLLMNGGSEEVFSIIDDADVPHDEVELVDDFAIVNDGRQLFFIHNLTLRASRTSTGKVGRCF